MSTLTTELHNMATINLFTEAKKKDLFVGRPYYLDYNKAYLFMIDAWKQKVEGIPQGTFLLAFYENENEDVDECLLLRALQPSKLPTDNDVIASMVEYYKDNLKTSGKENYLDDFTKYIFSTSGLECRILGTFFRNAKDNKIKFGADVENFYSAHNYVVYKPTDKVLTQIVNFKDGNTIVGGPSDHSIGHVRYSSSMRFQESQENVPIYVNSQDFFGKRTALFGMTRTGKSNTVKKIIEITTETNKAVLYNKDNNQNIIDNLKHFDESGLPKDKVGQIIFDINGEYANSNLQDEGTAIFEKYKDVTQRYSVLNKNGFKVMKINFYTEIENGFEFIVSHLKEESNPAYIDNFFAVNLSEPKDKYGSEYIRWQRRVAAYQCCLKLASFVPPSKFTITFPGTKEINDKIKENSIIDPSKGISLDDAISWFTWVANNINSDFFVNYKKNKKHDWCDDGLKALLVLLVGRRDLNPKTNITGYKVLNKFTSYHTNSVSEPFEKEIIDYLRKGKIVIIDLSQGDPKIQNTYSEKICKKIFDNSMENFISNKPNNFIQFYFEEAHNLFPKKDDKDLSQIYNRIAKEGAKLNLGMIYATQEVSSISSNILKNTQNWFIAHLNNEDEIKEIKKFYDFEDFSESLIRYSAGTDKGFIRMKTYSNAFVVPVQIDRFLETNGK